MEDLLVVVHAVTIMAVNGRTLCLIGRSSRGHNIVWVISAWTRGNVEICGGSLIKLTNENITSTNNILLTSGGGAQIFWGVQRFVMRSSHNLHSDPVVHCLLLIVSTKKLFARWKINSASSSIYGNFIIFKLSLNQLKGHEPNSLCKKLSIFYHLSWCSQIL